MTEQTSGTENRRRTASRKQTGSRNGQVTPHKRDAAATRQRILDAAREAFAQHGFTGARIDQIARASQANVQMLYRYFGGKEELYLAALEDTYARIRALERQLDLGTLAPADGMRRLVEFTFDYLRDNPEFVAMIRNENMAGGRFVRQLPMVSDSTLPLLEAVSDLLTRGRETGAFKRQVDPGQLYITVLSLCITHLAQRHTLSVMFRNDLGADDWLDERRAHAVEVVMGYLTAGPAPTPRG
ncbi:TetR/AcrR family transcriptional regulator [Lutibaculum baratangense]|uniref:Transcriptional regulator, TetR family n=1 Tax=Lutibaculum baratangense AMV1 TaxID=631454 RepID=V4RKE8_9HYPH|nr:TetR/AcrR family transcriptional regulator [Lutibaculum baratangense]ESR23730.1 Transcriptional regulator, TetR family [Lutibaculum baratangense AMV1]